MKKILTLCMVAKDDAVLLGMKKRGFGAGKWNGFGGKVESGETIEEAAAREMQEEVGLAPTVMHKVGILNFTFETMDPELEVHVFKVAEYHGTPVETEEMLPQWFSFDAIPFNDMWSDDELWFPYLKRDTYFKGYFLFNSPGSLENQAIIRSYSLEEVSTL